jgi:hypothetical protein
MIDARAEIPNYDSEAVETFSFGCS